MSDRLPAAKGRLTPNHTNACATSAVECLDFGAGACDQTVVLRQLGYHCAAVNDFQDPCHLEDDNRERIVRFAEGQDISVHVGLLPDGPLIW